MGGSSQHRAAHSSVARLCTGQRGQQPSSEENPFVPIACLLGIAIYVGARGQPFVDQRPLPIRIGQDVAKTVVNAVTEPEKGLVQRWQDDENRKAIITLPFEDPDPTG